MTDWRTRLQAALEGDRAGRIGLAASAAWLLMVALFWLMSPAEGSGGALARLLALAGVLMPVALIWLAVGLARAIAALRAEADELRAGLRQMGGDAAVPSRRDPRPRSPRP